MRRSCSDSLLTASQVDRVFGSDSGAFDSAELVVRRTLRAFDQKKSPAYPGRFSVRVASWLPRLLPRSVVVSAAAAATRKMGLASTTP
jgi:hypothetical protein